VNKKLFLGMALILVLILCITLIMIKKIKLPLEIRPGKLALSSVLSNQALDSFKKGDLLQAKSLYQRLTSEFPKSSEMMNWQNKLEETNLKLLFSPLLTPQSILYEIKPGDTLTKIAREFKTTVELISKSNNLKEDKILPGRKIKVWTAPFSLVVDKSQNTLILKSDEEVIKTYTVSTGINNSTPVGNFKILNKLINPTWFKTGRVVAPGTPDNILGSRWLGFDLSGYGIHGTTDPTNLGKQITQGCVRMLNSDIEELYDIIPIGTEITIVD